MRKLLWLALPLLLSCGGDKGRVRIQGRFANLNQADFLIYSPDGGIEDIDTLHLTKGEFLKDFAVKGGPYEFVIIYPNFSTLTFTASQGSTVTIEGDALALADVAVQGADSVIRPQATVAQAVLAVGQPLPRTAVIDSLRVAGRYCLVGFCANWRGGSTAVNTNIRRALREHRDSLCAITYSLDVDPTLLRVSQADREDSLWAQHCDFLCWESPDVRTLGINNIPYLILLNPNGQVLATGSSYNQDIEPCLKKK